MMGERGSFPGGAWIGLSFMPKKFPVSNQAMRAEIHCELKSPDRDAHCAHLLTCQGEEYVEHFLHRTPKT